MGVDMTILRIFSLECMVEKLSHYHIDLGLHRKYDKAIGAE